VFRCFHHLAGVALMSTPEIGYCVFLSLQFYHDLASTNNLEYKEPAKQSALLVSLRVPHLPSTARFAQVVDNKNF
jgi:hypothetical protein